MKLETLTVSDSGILPKTEKRINDESNGHIKMPSIPARRQKKKKRKRIKNI